MTGEFIEEAKAEPEVDPEVIKIADGRFFHRGRGAFVDSQYKGAAPASAVPVQAKAEPVKRGPRKAKAEEPAGNGSQPAPAAMTAQAAATPSVEEQQAVNSGINEHEKTVVAASPRLEELIKQMQPKKAN